MSKGPSQLASRTGHARQAPQGNATIRALNLGQLPIALTLFAFVFFIYIKTLSPTVAGGDSGDITVAAAVSGVAHPPGYPLLTLINKLFILFPFGSIAYRVNLTSAVFGAGAVVLVYLIVRRLGAGNLAGIVGALSLAFSSLFWSYSVVAEVFALNNFLVLLALLLLLLWERFRDDRLLYSFFLVNGLGISNHYTIVLLWPGFAYFLWSSSALSLVTLKRLCFAIVAFVLGLIPYVYIPIAASAHPPYSWDNADSLGRFVTLVTRADYGSFSLVHTEEEVDVPRLYQLVAFAKSLVEQLTPLGAVVGIVGGLFLLREKRRYFVLTFLSFVLAGPAFLVYANVEFDVPGALQILQKLYVLPLTLYALWIGYGIWRLAEFVQSKTKLGGTLAGTAVPLIFLAIPVILFVNSYQVVDQSKRSLAYNLGADILLQLPKDSLVVTFGDEANFVCQYLQLVEGVRQDVTVVASGLLANDWYRDQVRARYSSQGIPPESIWDRRNPTSFLIRDRLSKGFPVYLTGTLAEDFEKDFKMIPHGVLLQVVPREAQVNLDEVRTINTGLWSQYVNAEELRKPFQIGSWESKVVRYYAMPILYSGMLYERSSRYDDAIALYSKTIELSPDYSRPYDYTGGIYLNRKRDYALALQYYEKFLEVQPFSPPASEIRNSISYIKNRFNSR